MSTKINTFKHTPKVEQVKPKLKPIQIQSYFNYNGLVVNDGKVYGKVHIEDWDNVVLVCKNTNNCKYDTIMVYDDCMVNDDGTITHGVVCFGKWNDGVVK